MSESPPPDSAHTPGEAGPSIAEVLRRLSPQGGVAPHQALATLEARLFGRQRKALRIGRYRLLERIGSGGGGAVYRADDPKRGREIAIKLLHGEFGAHDPSARARLIREAQSLARLSHPNIIEILDVGTYDVRQLDSRNREADGGLGIFVAMEFVHGETLAQWLGATVRPWRTIIEVFIAAGRGLAAAHAQGIAHRDFKPANVLVGSDGRVRVLDFGLARVTGPAGASDAASARLSGLAKLAQPIDASLTATGAAVGTPAYMAPEQHDGRRGDARSDQYAFCLALYEGLFGQPPFPLGDLQTMLAAKRRGVSVLQPPGKRLPRRLRAVLERGLDPDPEARFPALQMLLAELDTARGQRNPASAWAAAGMLGVTTLLMLGTDMRPVRRCGGELDQAGVWNAARQQSLAAAFGARAQAGRAAIAPISARIDVYVAQAVGLHGVACATSNRAYPRAEVDDCLTARLHRLDVLIDVLSAPTASIVEHAVAAVSGLPDIAACDLLQPRPGAQASSAAARTCPDADALDRAAALESVKDTRGALALLEAVRSEFSSPSPCLARWTYERGSALVAHNDITEAEHALGWALWDAVRTRDDALAAASALRLLEGVAPHGEYEGDVALWSRQAVSAAARLPFDRGWAGRFHLAKSVHSREQADWAKAAASLDAAETALETLDPIHPLRIDVALGRAEMFARSGQFEAAETEWTHATEWARQVFGPAHPRTQEIEHARVRVPASR